MLSKQELHLKASVFFDELWSQGDYWQLESSPFEVAKYARQAELFSDRRYRRALEIGCGAGAFTHCIAAVADSVLAVDVSSAAIARARAARMSMEHVEFREANVMQFDPEAEGAWDLIVMSETIYYLGWLYSFFDVFWLAHQLFAATAEGGRLLMTNTCGGPTGYLLRPGIIHTYRDLMLNVGYQLEHEERFEGTKDETPLEVLVLLFHKH